MRSRRATRAALTCAASLTISAAAAHGLPTSGSWIINLDGSWSIPSNWLPDIPNGGGIATFQQHPIQSTARTVTLDTNINVGKMIFDSTYVWSIAGVGTPTLSLDGIAEIEVLRSNPSSPSAFAAGHGINRLINGINGLKKTGEGVITLGAANTYSGGTTVEEGVLRTTVGDAAFGSALNPLTVNGGTVRYSGSASGFNRPVTLGPNHGTFQTFVPITFGGVVSGTGDFKKEVGAAIAFEAANTYTGASKFQASGTEFFGPQSIGNIIYRNGGTALNTSNITSGGFIVLDNTTINFANRLPAVDTCLLGSGVTLLGNSLATTTEALGDCGVHGQTLFTVTPGTGQSAQLTANSVTRKELGTAVYRGTSLGAAAGPNVANIFVTTPPTLTGGGGAAGSTNISIIPGAIGATSSASAGDSLVTYGATGVRPLANSEYATIVAAGPTDNVRVTTASNVAAAKTVNAVVVATGGSIAGTGPLSITSGQFVNAATATHTVNVDFGTAEGLLNTPSAATFSGVISGSGGVVKSGVAAATLTGPNTYTGATTIVAGQITVSGSLPQGAPSPLGNSTQPIVFRNYGTGRLYESLANEIISRDIEVRGKGSGVSGLGTTGNFPLTVNGNILLERQLNLEGGNAAAPMVVNGVVSGAGRLGDSFGAYVILNAANTFSGGIEVGNGGFLAGHNQAFGTGKIWVVGAGAIGAFGADRTINNDIVLLSNVTFATTPTRKLTINAGIDMAGANPATGDGAFIINTPADTETVVTGTVSNGAITKEGDGWLRLFGDNIYGGGTTVNDGWLEAGKLTGGKLTVNGGGWARITLKPIANDPSGTSVVPDLDVNSTGVFDLTNNSFVINYDFADSLLSEFRGYLRTGRVVTSSAFRAAPITRLGYADNAAFAVPRTTFAGVSVDASSILVKFTYSGDADLDGDADGVDISAWAVNFTGELSGGAGATKVWTQGDWDYDGDVDGLDASLWALAFTGELSGGGLGEVVVNAPAISREAVAILEGLGITVVPEPLSAAACLSAVAAWSLQRTRRR